MIKDSFIALFIFMQFSLQKNSQLRKETQLNLKSKDFQYDFDIKDLLEKNVKSFLPLLIILIATLILIFYFERQQSWILKIKYFKQDKCHLLMPNEFNYCEDGTLIKLKGYIHSEDKIMDNLMGVKVQNCLKLRRQVQKLERFQPQSWFRKQKPCYLWINQDLNFEEIKDSQLIKNYDQQKNIWQFKSRNFYNNNAYLDGFRVKEELINQLKNYNEYQPSNEDLLNIQFIFSEKTKNSILYISNDNYIYFTANYEQAVPGDFRIKYYYIPMDDYEILAGLNNQQLEKFYVSTRDCNGQLQDQLCQDDQNIISQMFKYENYIFQIKKVVEKQLKLKFCFKNMKKILKNLIIRIIFLSALFLSNNKFIFIYLILVIFTSIKIINGQQFLKYLLTQQQMIQNTAIIGFTIYSLLYILLNIMFCPLRCYFLLIFTSVLLQLHYKIISQASIQLLYT